MIFKPGDLVCLGGYSPERALGPPVGYAGGSFIGSCQRDIAYDQPLLFIEEAPTPGLSPGDPHGRLQRDWRTVVLVNEELVTVYTPYVIRYPENGFKENV